MNRLPLFPITTKTENNLLTIAGHDLSALAEEFSTPLYLYDRATMDIAATEYKSSLTTRYPSPAFITYAGKAFLNRAVAQWTQTHGLYVDCTGEGEIAMAVAGGVPREHILVHGVNKSSADLAAAVKHAGTIVADNLTELERIANQFPIPNYHLPNLWLRLLPGVSVQTHHAHTQTGQHDSKFGMTSAEIMEAAQFCKAKGLPLNGIHFHQGSNFRDAGPLKVAIELGLDLAAEMGLADGWHFSPGGGWGVAYHEDELPQPNADDYVRVIAESIIGGTQARRLSMPHLHLEPGRSLVARAGVAVYRVGAIKHRGEKVWILTDGGMTDNPRHAMYRARYSCLAVSNPDGENVEKVSIAGPYCESGDVVIEDLPMPKLEVGDLIAVPASGAYQLSMSSNYNGSRKPAVLLLEEGQAQLIQRRETIEDLLRRDLGL
ncbi:MAG: diaminopimelate decarboxylase [Chloroflexi bacterium]|nr:diaminopimelate decarboxylase [Chloroflexota bacterium]